MFAEGSLTSESLVRSYIDRINRFDSGSNGLHSMLEINPDAIQTAVEKDNERKAGTVTGPMHGIPVAVKDNISTVGPMHTRAGSLALAGNISPYDAFIIKKLKDAGAIILGKANLTEFANIMTRDMPGGYSSMGGQTWCPYKENESPSGSSSGSAVAVSANLCMVSIGTETTGSIISPAQRNGIVGIKPTIGILSRRGILPVSKTLDTAGPMARTVEDAAILLIAMYGNDEKDSMAKEIPGKFDIDNIRNLDSFSLKGIRIGINRNRPEWMVEEPEVFEKIFSTLKHEGAEIVDGFNVGPSGCAASIIVHELREGMNEYFSSMADDFEIKSLSDVIAFNERYRDVHRYGQVYLEMANDKFPLGTKSEEYLLKLAERETETQEFDDIFTNYNLDVMFFESMTDLPPVTGFPSITVPVGAYENGLPMGSNWVSRRFDDVKLIKIAYAIEKLTKARLIPDLSRFENVSE